MEHCEEESNTNYRQCMAAKKSIIDIQWNLMVSISVNLSNLQIVIVQIALLQTARTANLIIILLSNI